MKSLWLDRGNFEVFLNRSCLGPSERGLAPGADPGGGRLLGDPKTLKGGKNVTRMCARKVAIRQPVGGGVMGGGGD